MPAFVHLTLHALLGSLLAWCTRTAPRARAYFWAWPVFLGLAYTTAVLLPVAAYHFRYYPDFSLGYAFDPVLYPWADAQVHWLGLLAAVSYLATFLSGYAVTRAGLLRRGRVLAVSAPVIVLVAALTFATLVGSDRCLLRSDYADFWRGRAVPWTGTPSGGAGIAAYLVALIGLRYVERRWRHRDPTLLGQL